MKYSFHPKAKNEFLDLEHQELGFCPVITGV
jgi:hypothetical protein